MGILATAGMISGAGQAMGRSLDQLQHGVILSGLQKERQELEDKRLALTFGHDKEMQAEQFRHADDVAERQIKNQRELHAADREAEQRRHQETLGSNIVTNTQRLNESREDRAQKGEQFEKELTQKVAQLTEQARLKREEIAAETKRSTDKNASTERIWKGREGAMVDAAGIRGAGKTASPASSKSGKSAALEGYKAAVMAGDQELTDYYKQQLLAQEELPSIQSPFPTRRKAENGEMSDSFSAAQQERDGMKKKPEPKGLLNSAQPSNLPKMGNVQEYKEYTAADIDAFLRDTEAAKRNGGNVSAVTEKYKLEFGHLPGQKDYDRLNAAKKGR